MSVRRRNVKQRVEREQRLQAGFEAMTYELRMLQMAIARLRAAGLTYVTQAQLADMLKQVRAEQPR